MALLRKRAVVSAAAERKLIESTTALLPAAGERDVDDANGRT
jgi:hypothetical protein